MQTEASLSALDLEAEAIYYEDEGEDLVRGDGSFHVQNAEHANWVVNKLAGWKDEIERIKAEARAEVGRREKKIAWFEARFKAELELFAEAALAGGRTKKLHLPGGGSLFFRHVNATVKPVEGHESELLAWAETNCPAAIRKELRFTPITDSWKETGAVPPGMELVPEHEGFYIGTGK